MMLSEYLQRQQDESYYDFIKRIVYGKLVNKTIDLDYAELSELLFGEGNCFNSSEVRKRMYGMKRFLDMLEEDGFGNFEQVTEDEVLDKIRQEKEELEKVRLQIKDERREYKKIFNKVARDEQLIDLFSDLGNKMSKTNPFVVNSKSQLNTVQGNKEAVLMLSDWHSELEISNFLNQFNKHEFSRRIEKLISRTIANGKLHNIKVLNVVNLGDLVSGVIHSTLRINANEDTVSQVMVVCELLADMLYEFSLEFEIVNFYSVIDNHSRVSADKKESLNKENFMRFVPWYLKPRLSEMSNVNIFDNILDEEICIFKVCGYTCFGVHGHNDKVSNVVQNLALMTRQFPDYVLLSHYHHNMSDETHGVEIIVNPCLSGVDEYSKDKRLSSKPAQKLLVFNPDDGLECAYSIRVDK